MNKRPSEADLLHERAERARQACDVRAPKDELRKQGEELDAVIREFKKLIGDQRKPRRKGR